MIPLSSKLAALTLLLVSTTALHAELYKWNDENGQIYYSQTKPLDYKYEVVGPPPPPPTFAPDLNKPFEEQIRDSIKKQPQKPEAESAEDKKIRAARCEKLKDNLMKLETYGRIRSLNPDGSFSSMTDEEKQEKISESQKQIDLDCKD